MSASSWNVGHLDVTVEDTRLDAVVQVPEPPGHVQDHGHDGPIPREHATVHHAEPVVPDDVAVRKAARRLSQLADVEQLAPTRCWAAGGTAAAPSLRDGHSCCS
jgi:hypothetical protein